MMNIGKKDINSQSGSQGKSNSVQAPKKESGLNLSNGRPMIFGIGSGGEPSGINTEEGVISGGIDLSSGVAGKFKFLDPLINLLYRESEINGIPITSNKARNSKTQLLKYSSNNYGKNTVIWAENTSEGEFSSDSTNIMNNRKPIGQRGDSRCYGVDSVLMRVRIIGRGK